MVVAKLWGVPPPRSPTVRVGVNEHKDFFQVLIPAPSQKPLFTDTTSLKTVRTFSESRAGFRVKALSEGIFSRQGWTLIARALQVMPSLNLAW